MRLQEPPPGMDVTLRREEGQPEMSMNSRKCVRSTTRPRRWGSEPRRTLKDVGGGIPSYLMTLNGLDFERTMVTIEGK